MNIHSWETLPFNKYLELTTLEQSENELTNGINLVSIINDIPIEEVEKMGIAEYQKMVSTLEFLQEQPDLDKVKTKWKLKNIDKITMQDFIQFENEKTDTANIPSILAMMTNVSENEILSLPTDTVLKGFFLLNKHLNRYINRSACSLAVRVNREKLLNKLLFWRKK